MKEMINDTFKTKDGMTVRARPLLPTDAPYFVDIFKHMSPDSRYSRFHQSLDDVALERVWAEAESIAHTQAQAGFIAFADLPDQLNAPIGAARYVETGDGAAETAVSVRDDMQGQGIGTQLMALLAEEARARGVDKLTAMIQSSNKAIIRVLNRLPYRYERTAVGADTEVVLDLTFYDE